MNDTPSVSVVVCTHNPRKANLLRVLQALKSQTLPLPSWELLIIDNASILPVAKRFDITWHPNARHIIEDKVGLTFARLRGIGEALAEILVFVDDDNVLIDSYLSTVLDLARRYPWLGAWSGSCLAEFEALPSRELAPWTRGLVIEELKYSLWAKLPHFSDALPPGAGLAIKREVALHYRELVSLDPRRQALGRQGTRLGAGEDTDMCLCSFYLGLGTGRFPELVLTHLIDETRVTLKYLEGIHEGFGYANVILEDIHQMEVRYKRPPFHKWRIELLSTYLSLSGKSREEKTMRLAMERGRLRALQDLENASEKTED